MLANTHSWRFILKQCLLVNLSATVVAQAFNLQVLGRELLPSANLSNHLSIQTVLER